jgi:hypothetical protein
MLMSGGGKIARIHYLAGTFRLLSDGDHVICAITGARIQPEGRTGHLQTLTGVTANSRSFDPASPFVEDESLCVRIVTGA